MIRILIWSDNSSHSECFRIDASQNRCICRILSLDVSAAVLLSNIRVRDVSKIVLEKFRDDEVGNIMVLVITSH